MMYSGTINFKGGYYKKRIYKSIRYQILFKVFALFIKDAFSKDEIIVSVKGLIMGFKGINE